MSNTIDDHVHIYVTRYNQNGERFKICLQCIKNKRNEKSIRKGRKTSSGADSK
jgi:hypothetical protein